MAMIKFEPLLKQTLWGGDKIIPFKHLSAQMENVGESWEISGVKDNETIVANGPDKGKSLNQLVREQKELLVGKENYQRFGDEFPLLIKFIDARQDLSIQVHPTDEIAHRQGKPRGKTEMWYALGSQESGDRSQEPPMLYNGLKQQITPEQYKEMVENDTITDALARYEVHEGDVFFIPAGRIHAIGAGCFVAEIQQTSDVTYRIYDFKRKDKDGNYRELHTKEAAESINYTVLPNYRTEYELPKNEGVQVVTCPYFTTAVYDLNEPMTLDYSELDSFVILIAVKGSGSLTANGETITFQMGDTVLLPATTDEVKVEGEVKFLETYV
ncbi:MAG: class I mannose-6-phosphate isomerase [Prevotella sp.]|nr:class I mannose-6-phosphate isomerase [Prevotella sp.]